MNFARREFVALTAAALFAPPARAADTIIAGTLGGQAPLWPFYIAVHEGFFTAHGLDVQINFAQSGAAVVQQLTGGSLEVALSVGITDPVVAIDKGASLAIVRIIGDSAPYVLIGKPGLKSIADLKGKTVCIGNANDITSVYFERMAAADGLARKDYDVLAAGVAAARYAALKAGVVDAALVLPPINFEAAKAGYVTLGFAADYVKDLPFTAMAVLKSWAATHQPAVRRLLAATDESIAWFADPAHRKQAIALLVKSAHSSEQNAQASYDFIRRIHYFEPTSKVSRAKLRNVIDAERSVGKVAATMTPDRLVMPGLTDLVP